MFSSKKLFLYWMVIFVAILACGLDCQNATANSLLAQTLTDNQNQISNQVKNELETINQKIDEINQTVNTRLNDSNQAMTSRVSDINNFNRTTLTIMGAFIGALSLFTAIGTYVSFKSEKSDLKDFKEEIRKEIKDLNQETKKEIDEILGKATKRPEMVFLGINRQPLEKQIVPASLNIISEEQNRRRISFEFILKNQGESISGPIFAKIYSKGLLRLNSASSDESDFDYEAGWGPGNFQNFPGGYSAVYALSTPIKEIPQSGKYPVLLKAYYGNGQISSTEFTLYFPK